MIGDVRLALRTWARSPTVAAAAAAALALGIGAVTVVFSVADAVLLRSLPGTAVEGLVRVNGIMPGGGPVTVSGPELAALRDDSGVFGALAGERINTLRLTLDGRATSVGGAAVTLDYFRVVGVPMALGAGFPPYDEDALVAVLSHALWREAFGADPAALGRIVRVGGLDLAVVGVAGAGFQGAFPGFRASVFVPLALVQQVFPNDGSPELMADRFLNAVGTPAPGADVPAAERRLAALASGLSGDPDFPEGRRLELVPARGLHPGIKPVAAGLTGALFAVAGLVLLVACANVANLLLARGVARRGEMAARMALGASRGRLARQVLTECLVLGVGGAAMGAALAAWGIAALTAAQSTLEVPILLELALSPRPLGFAAAAGIACSVLFGTLPALRSSDARVAIALRSAAQQGDVGAGRTQSVLVAAQVCVTAVLVSGATLMLRSVGGIDGLDPGFDRHAVVTVEADASGRSQTEGRAFLASVAEAARSTPDVEAAALGLFVHLGGRSDQLQVAPADAPPDAWTLGAALYSAVEPEYFRVVGIPFLRGRTFNADLVGDGAAQAVVNRTLAERLWPAPRGDGTRVACARSRRRPARRPRRGRGGDREGTGAQRAAHAVPLPAVRAVVPTGHGGARARSDRHAAP